MILRLSSFFVTSYIIDLFIGRCQQYMKFCGNDNIFSKDVSSLHKHFYICDSHFKNSDYHVMNGRKYLNKIAVPCLLPPPEPLPEHRVFAFCQSSRVVLGKCEVPL